MIFNNLLYKSILRTSGLLIIGLIAIFLTTRFGNSLGEAVAGNIATKDIFKIVGLKTLISVQDILPIALFIGIFAVITSLVNNREWLALQSCGMPQTKLFFLVLKISLLTAFIVAISSLILNPVLETRLRELKEETKNRASIEGIKSGVFIKFGKNQVFYSESKSVNDRKFLKPLIVKRKNTDKEVLRSNTAFIESQRSTGDKFAVFENGTTISTNSSDDSFSKTDFDRYLVRIEQKKFSEHDKYLDFIPTNELLLSNNLLHRIELQWRLVPIFLCVFMAITSVAVAVNSYNKSWHSGLLITIAIYFIYSNSLGTIKSMLRKGEIPMEVGLWPVHVLFCVGLLFLIIWKNKINFFTILNKTKIANKDV